MPKFFKATPISTDFFECVCGWRCETVSGDEEKAKARTDLLVRLHQKKCVPLQEQTQIKVSTLTHSEKKGTTVLVNEGSQAVFNTRFHRENSSTINPTKLVKHYNCKGSQVVAEVGK